MNDFMAVHDSTCIALVVAKPASMQGPFWRSVYALIPKDPPILLKFSPEVVFQQEKKMFEESLKNFNFF